MELEVSILVCSCVDHHDFSWSPCNAPFMLDLDVTVSFLKPICNFHSQSRFHFIETQSLMVLLKTRRDPLSTLFGQGGHVHERLLDQLASRWCIGHRLPLDCVERLFFVHKNLS